MRAQGEKTGEGAASAVRMRARRSATGQTPWRTKDLCSWHKRPGEKCGLGTAQGSSRELPKSLIPPLSRNIRRRKRSDRRQAFHERTAWLGRGRSRPGRVGAERARTSFALRGSGPAMGHYTSDAAKPWISRTVARQTWGGRSPVLRVAAVMRAEAALKPPRADSPPPVPGIARNRGPRTTARARRDTGKGPRSGRRARRPLAAAPVGRGAQA